MRFPENAPRNPDELLERRDGLQHVSASGAIGFELGPSVQTAHLERNVMVGSQLSPSNWYYRPTISRPTSNTSRRVVGQWGGAGGACCEDHFRLERGVERVVRVDEVFGFLCLLVCYRR